MGIDKKSLIRTAILSAILGFNGVTAMAAELTNVNGVQEDNIDGQDCIVCLDAIDARRGGVSILPCGHQFHNGCVNNWLDRAGSCPLCKQTASKNDSKSVDLRKCAICGKPADVGLTSGQSLCAKCIENNCDDQRKLSRDVIAKLKLTKGDRISINGILPEAKQIKDEGFGEIKKAEDTNQELANAINEFKDLLKNEKNRGWLSSDSDDKKVHSILDKLSSNSGTKNYDPAEMKKLQDEYQTLKILRQTSYDVQSKEANIANSKDKQENLIDMARQTDLVNARIDALVKRMEAMVSNNNEKTYVNKGEYDKIDLDTKKDNAKPNMNLDVYEKPNYTPDNTAQVNDAPYQNQLNAYRAVQQQQAYQQAMYQQAMYQQPYQQQW